MQSGIVKHFSDHSLEVSVKDIRSANMRQRRWQCLYSACHASRRAHRTHVKELGRLVHAGKSLWFRIGDLIVV